MGTHANAPSLTIAAGIGTATGLASLPVHLLIGHARSVELAALLLAAIGAIHAGFVLQSGSAGPRVAEIAVAAGFAAAAVAGLWVSVWIIPAAYLLHGGWDWLHHGGDGRFVAIPRCYPPFCAAVDVVTAGGLVLVWLR